MTPSPSLIVEAILNFDVEYLQQLSKDHPRKEMPGVTTSELKKMLCKLAPRQHPEFFNFLSEWLHRHGFG